jgi:hypothetical protein
MRHVLPEALGDPVVGEPEIRRAVHVLAVFVARIVGMLPAEALFEIVRPPEMEISVDAFGRAHRVAQDLAEVQIEKLLRIVGAAGF